MNLDLNYWSFTVQFDDTPFTGVGRSGHIGWTPPQANNVVIRQVRVNAVCNYDLSTVGRGITFSPVSCLVKLFSESTATRPICTVPSNLNVDGAPFFLGDNGVQQTFSNLTVFDGEIIMPLNGQMYWEFLWLDDPSLRSAFTNAQISGATYEAYLQVGYTLKQKI